MRLGTRPYMTALFLRDLRLGIRAGGGALTGVLFFLAVIATIPFAVGPDLNLLARIGPAILWIGALLASLLGLDRLFQADREDGSLDLMILAADRHMLALTVLVKCLAHWTASVLPLVIAAPLLGLFMNIEPAGLAAATLTLLVGTPAITFIGAVGAAVAVALPRGGLMVSVLVLPLAIPVLIFGVSASYAAVAEPDPFLPPFLHPRRAVGGFAVIGPVAAAIALRWSAIERGGGETNLHATARLGCGRDCARRLRIRHTTDDAAFRRHRAVNDVSRKRGHDADRPRGGQAWQSRARRDFPLPHDNAATSTPRSTPSGSWRRSRRGSPPREWASTPSRPSFTTICSCRPTAPRRRFAPPAARRRGARLSSVGLVPAFHAPCHAQNCRTGGLIAVNCSGGRYD